MGIDVGTVIAMLGLSIVVVAHLCSTVWWMSKITTTLDILAKSVDEIKNIIARHEATYYTKEEAAKDFAHRDAKIDAAWSKLDKLIDENHHK